MSRASEIAEALSQVKADLPPEVTLIVVTKNFPASDAQILYDLGERNFGENRDLEGLTKSALLPADINWHYQGGIQSKKIKSIVGWADYIHSLDEIAHAKKIAEIATRMGKTQPVFIQVNLDDQPMEHRSGVSVESFEEFAILLSEIAGLKIMGVMGVAPLGRDPEPSFATLASISARLIEISPAARFISAGMSGDYKIALRYGATHIRIGSSILGSR